MVASRSRGNDIRKSDSLTKFGEHPSCHESRTNTADFTNDSEKKFRCSYYQFRTTNGDKKSGNWRYNRIKRILDDIPERSYNNINWNCQHFTRNMFYKRL